MHKYIYLSLILICNCTSKAPFDYEIERIDSFSVIYESFESTPSDITIDRDGNFYISNTSEQTINKYSSDGILIKSVGGIGRGPGEYEENKAIRLSSNQDYIIAHTVGGVMINKYSHDLEIQETLITSSPLYASVLMENGGYILFYISAGDNKKVELKDENFDDVDSSYRLLNHYNIFFSNTLFPAKATNDHFLVSYAFINQVRVFSLDGTLTNWFQIPGLPDEITKFKPQPIKPNIGGFKSPEHFLLLDANVDLASGKVYFLEGDFSNYAGRRVHVMTSDGAYIKTLELPVKIQKIIPIQETIFGLESDSVRSRLLKFQEKETSHND